jgi:hypothetical protein
LKAAIVLHTCRLNKRVKENRKLQCLSETETIEVSQKTWKWTLEIITLSERRETTFSLWFVCR